MPAEFGQVTRHLAATILLLFPTFAAQGAQQVGDCIVRTGALCAAENLEGENFSSVIALYAEFERVRLVDATLDRAYFSGADFCMADLDGASLSKALLEGADLRGADTGTANFVGATTARCRGGPPFPGRELR
ncbi:MAG TPA: pentapeptide repeat-containing protein [Paucimonas sp.]|nr:pentapeptide repeat-containing protein [Paucimonas sp.]